MSDLNTTDRFWIQPPVGHEVVNTCSSGHPVVWKHSQTGATYTPLVLNGTIACSICIAIQVGVVCNRTHMVFEVGEE